MLTEVDAKAAFDEEVAVWGHSATDTHMVCSPMYHTVAIRFSAGTLLNGGSLAILTRFDAVTALEKAAAKKAPEPAAPARPRPSAPDPQEGGDGGPGR